MFDQLVLTKDQLLFLYMGPPSQSPLAGRRICGHLSLGWTDENMSVLQLKRIVNDSQRNRILWYKFGISLLSHFWKTFGLTGGMPNDTWGAWSEAQEAILSLHRPFRHEREVSTARLAFGDICLFFVCDISPK